MKITAEIEPVPLARHQINTQNHGRFLPKRSQNFKDELSWIARSAMANEEPVIYPVRVTTHIFKKYKHLEDMVEKNTGDIDNFVKAVFDAFNGVVWADDRQVIELHAFKHYSKNPRVEVDFEKAQLLPCNATAESVLHLIKSVAQVQGKSIEEILAEVGAMLS
jgi:Holliday junction resolvase RusA-like endonuclease